MNTIEFGCDLTAGLSTFLVRFVVRMKILSQLLRVAKSVFIRQRNGVGEVLVLMLIQVMQPAVVADLRCQPCKHIRVPHESRKGIKGLRLQILLRSQHQPHRQRFIEPAADQAAMRHTNRAQTTAELGNDVRIRDPDRDLVRRYISRHLTDIKRSRVRLVSRLIHDKDLFVVQIHRSRQPFFGYQTPKLVKTIGHRLIRRNQNIDSFWIGDCYLPKHFSR